MKRLTIAGKIKKDKNYCSTCRNGKDFSKEQYFQTDFLGDNHKEYICDICKTKYQQPFIPLGIIVENFITENISLKDYNGWVQNDDGSLTKQNASYHMIRIGLQLKQEEKMLGNQREKYEETGICENHHYILSHPFKTTEGRFQVECCPICMKAKIVYKGIAYHDSIMNIVRFIAHQGIEFDKLQTQIAVPNFDIETVKEIEKATQELPNFNIEQKEITQPIW